MIVYVVAFFASAVIVFLPYFIHDKIQRKQIQRQAKTEPFIVSEYYDRMEQVALDILENQEPVDQTIILWWGLDGLRLNEDGSLEWISRKKCKQCPNNDLIQYENEMEKLRDLYRMASQINAPSLAMQTIMAQMQTVQNVAIISQLPPPAIGYLGYSPYMQSAFVSPLQQCCVQYPA